MTCKSIRIHARLDGKTNETAETPKHMDVLGRLQRLQPSLCMAAEERKFFIAEMYTVPGTVPCPFHPVVKYLYVDGNVHVHI